MTNGTKILGVLILIIIFSGSNESDSVQENYSVDVPEDYYNSSSTNWGNLGYHGLIKLVQNGLVAPYQEDVFDCSEMSAYMEWYLEKYGFNASICTSQYFKGSKGHAWVRVDTKDGKTVYIESTAKSDLIIVDPKDYDHPERVYESIYEVGNVEEYDWWK